MGKTDFSVQFEKIVTRIEKIGYKVDILRQPACIVVKQIMADNSDTLFNCRAVGPQTKGRLPFQFVSNGRANRSPLCGFLVLWLPIAIVLFHYSVFYHMCFTMMFHS